MDLSRLYYTIYQITNLINNKIYLANSKHQTGSKNSQYGTMWITDGNINKKINKLDNIPEGWYKGRSISTKHSSLV